jgi:acyl-CoA reductase-like NAD-dependent aldehyde dehydrogenase
MADYALIIGGKRVDTEHTVDVRRKPEGVAVRLECGTAWVNQHAGLHPMAPHSGVKNSGIGVEFTVDGLKEYTTVQVLSVAR